MADGRAGGYYHDMQGEVRRSSRGASGGVVSYVKSRKTGQEQRIESDFIIDCTGLEADISEHRVLADLLKYSGADRNPLGPPGGRAALRDQGDRERRRRPVRVGAATLGGYFPGVDTFLGLQIAAQEIADDLARRGWCKQDRPGAVDRPVVQVGHQHPDLTAKEVRMVPTLPVASRPGSSCSPRSA